MIQQLETSINGMVSVLFPTFTVRLAMQPNGMLTLSFQFKSGMPVNYPTNDTMSSPDVLFPSSACTDF